MTSVGRAIRCRQIGETDIPTVAKLLTRGFPARTHQFWLNALGELARHDPPPGMPKFGYFLESDGAAVGVILLISSTVQAGGASSVRCNLSSWYVDPNFRSYATLLIARALRHDEVTYTNVSAAPHTWPIIEAQGFSRYCDGVFVAVPILSVRSESTVVQAFDVHRQPNVGFDRSDAELLRRHAERGCVCLWCVTPQQAYPFVFRHRVAKRALPYAQMIYCRDVADFVRFAAPIGRYLARRGSLFVVIDANGPIPGLVGQFRRDSMPKFFKGPQRPRLGDLAYTEYAIMGV